VSFLSLRVPHVLLLLQRSPLYEAVFFALANNGRLSSFDEFLAKHGVDAADADNEVAIGLALAQLFRAGEIMVGHNPARHAPAASAAASTTAAGGTAAAPQNIFAEGGAGSAGSLFKFS
jgi:hypothetical protein